MNTYLCYLDDASLFELLKRLHYEDLINLCKTRRYLYKIICTPFFQESWKKYNISIVTSVKAYQKRVDEVDRNGLKHGVCRLYNVKNNELLAEVEHIQGLRCGLGKYWADGIHFIDTFVSDKPHGSSVVYWHDKVEYQSYIEGKQQGLIRSYYKDGRRYWAESQDSHYHGKVIQWNSNGTLQQIEIFHHGKLLSGKYFKCKPISPF